MFREFEEYKKRIIESRRADKRVQSLRDPVQFEGLARDFVYWVQPLARQIAHNI